MSEVTLRSWQREALRESATALEDGRKGLVRAIMGAGKSVVVAKLCELGLRNGWHVVVTVPTQELVRQLADTIEWVTGQPVGQWYADHKELWPVTVVCQASLASYEHAWRLKYKELNVIINATELPQRLWIADECHRTECDTVLSWSRPARRIGMSATPWRAEFTGTISSFDEVLYEYGAERAYEDGHIVKPTLSHPEPGDVDDVVAAWVAKQEGGGVANARDIKDANAFAARIGATAVHSESDFDAVDARNIIRDGGTVVYVDMLAEGFDCPEIRWMALRRPVGSRVRFAQEVGRGLRGCEGKDTCRMLDVYDLWGAHSMDWQAALGDYDSAVVPALKLDWIVEKSEWDPKSGEQMPPELLSPLRSWIRHERVQALFEGRIDGKQIGSTSWRSNPCSRKQLAYLDKLMRRLDPKLLDGGMVRRIKTARAALVDCIGRDAAELQGAFRSGDASDLIDILRGLQ